MRFPPLALIFLAAAFLSSCATLPMAKNTFVTKVAVVRPIEKDGTVVSAHVYFPGVPWKEYHPAPEGRVPLYPPGDAPPAPLGWFTERHPDGTLRITWTGRRDADEEPFLTEEGFHYVRIPPEKIHIIGSRGRQGPPFRPATIIMGGNTAYLPKAERSTP